MPQTSPLRLGILGCANIARQFARDVAGSPAIRLAAVASRDIAKAQEFGDAFAIPTRHGSYEALLADRNIDAVYIPLPNSMHAEWSIRASGQGKHVLCEKPLGLNLAETQSMFDAARAKGVLLLESYPYWFQPQTADLLRLIDGGEASDIGVIRSVQTAFGFTLRNPESNIRMNHALGGGALMDAGCYPLSLIRLVMGAAPVRVHAEAIWTATNVDISTSATLIYADGRRVQFSCAMDAANHRRALIIGSKGAIETEFLNHTSEANDHPLGYLPSQMRVRRGIANSVPFEEVTSATGSGFRFAAERFARMVATRDFAAMDFYAAASNDIAATLDAIARSARSGAVVAL